MKSLFLRLALFAALILNPLWAIAGVAQTSSARSIDPSPAGNQPFVTINIPGTERSFLRMAAISSQASKDEILPLLAHNVVVDGYTYDRKGKNPVPSEYLKLLKDYIDQARELSRLGDSHHIIHLTSCDQAGPLLRTLGYDLATPCGPNTSLETADREKAFLTDDSGFPLTALEQTLRGGQPFEYKFDFFKVPVLFKPGDWTALDSNKKHDLVDAIILNPSLARLYWAMARMDRETRNFLVRSPGLKTLLPLAPVLDFYGDQLMIESGRVMVPGGTAAEAEWKKMAGVSPDSPAQFVTHLMAKDRGWMAAFFDALSRVRPAEQSYLTTPQHMREFYDALENRDPSPGAARAVFRPDPGLVLLVSGIRLNRSGDLQIPGSLATWKQVLDLLHHEDHSGLIRKWDKKSKTWNDPSQLLAAMFAFSRLERRAGPLQLYLTLRAIDRERSAENRLSPQTVLLLAKDFSVYGDQYMTFSEFPLSNESIAGFLKTAQSITRIHNDKLRSDALGIFESNVGLWKIFARQDEIEEADWNRSWQALIDPYSDIRSDEELYRAARKSLGAILQAAAGRPDLSQDEIVDLLAGPPQTSDTGKRVKGDLADKIRSMMAAQRLVSLDTLFALGNGLEHMSRGQAPSENLMPLAARLRQFQLPKPLFTRSERAEWSMGLYENRHIQAEMHTNLAPVIKEKGPPRKLAEAIGELVPFLRDTLVGLNYAYYETPGAQMIYNNTLFVRSHDFSGGRTLRQDQAWRTPELFGRGLPAAGGAHLVGSLADLPYVLAQVEEDFMVPKTVQSLIWEDLVPTFLTSAIVPRWWRVTPNELHAVTLYQVYGEQLVRAGGTDSNVRQQVMGILSERLLPRRFEEVKRELKDGRSNEALALLTPGDTFSLAMIFRQKFPSEDPRDAEAGKELDQLAKRYPEEVSWERLSKDFGVPHPALDRTEARTLLLAVKPFPTYMGYSSRLLAESWDSNNLYWAKLADEKGYPPVMLNLLVPQLTYRMIENIAATYLDDWPALLRSLRETGKEFQQGKLASIVKMDAPAGF